MGLLEDAGDFDGAIEALESTIEKNDGILLFEAIKAYHSQFVVPESNRKIVDWLEASAVFYGSRIGVDSGEPFYVHEPLGIGGLDGIL